MRRVCDRFCAQAPKRHAGAVDSVDYPLRQVGLGPGIPPFEGGFASVFTNDRDRACVERKMHAQAQVKTEPAHRQRPEGVAVPEADGLGNSRTADLSDYPVEPGGNLRGRFPTGNLAGPDSPAWDRPPDFLAGLALIVAVEPLSEILVDLRLVRANEPSQLRGLTGPSPWAAQDELEILGCQVAVQGACLLLAGVGERQVGDRGVLARPTPFGFPMPDEEEAGWHAVHGIAAARLGRFTGRLSAASFRRQRSGGGRMAHMSDRRSELPNRQIPFSDAFKKFIVEGWAPCPADLPDQLPAAAWARRRRERVSAQFPGERLVIPAGGLKVRSNDTDYRFRPHSAFAQLTGLGTDREPDAVLVLEPTDSGHEATLYFKPRTPRDSEEFYADSRFGELWVGRRPSLEEMSALCDIPCAAISDLPDQLRKNSETVTLRVLAADLDHEIRQVIEEIRSSSAATEVDQGGLTTEESDQKFAVALSELRLIKDSYEISEMREACRQTAAAFEAVVAGIPEAVRRGRGERWIEGIFGLHARHLGNAVGYDTIAAAGEHACTLHWIRNDGEIREGELLLFDAGIELVSLYTADVTRTLPINGTFSDEQRMVYDAVFEAHQAGIAAAQPGATFSDVHKAAIAVIARYLDTWGVLPVSVAESLGEQGGQHRRWMVHGTSHHLGIDVHDCAQARVENYREGILQPGMIITVEPGLYFKPEDELVPQRLRGIGVRIEDDILITSEGNENLTKMLPRTSVDVEAWMSSIWARS
jgi:Xaa-Pro aminopeptidase